MPRADNYEDDALIRDFYYGVSQVGKTNFAISAALAGFNVILMNSDGNEQVLAKLPAEARKRIYIVNTIDKGDRPIAYTSAITLTSRRRMFVNETTGEVQLSAAMFDPSHDVIEIDIDKMTQNDVLIWDSYTAIVDSANLKFARENNIDITAAAKKDWDGFRWTGQAMSMWLSQLKQVPCHTIVIGHEETYERRNSEQTVIDTRVQAISTSGPHSKKLAKYFSQVLYFFLSGTKRRISTRAMPGRDGGTRIMEEREWNAFVDLPRKAGADDLTFEKIARQLGVKCPTDNPEFSSAGIRVVPADEIGSAATKPKSTSAASTPTSENTVKPTLGKLKLG